jgi:V8-like Glu-specific endopeptidase
MRLPGAIVAVGLLALSNVASAAPFWTNVFNFPPLQICKPPPTPKLIRIDAASLAKIVKPYMPPFVNGVANITSFRPKPLNFTRIADTFLVQDVHIKEFLKIAPKSARLFMRREVLNQTRTSYPYSTFGKVFVRDGARVGSCSGATVGPNLLLTANHCVPWNSTTWSLEFVPAFDAEDPVPRPFGSAFAVQCVGIQPAVVDGRDYAVCQLDVPIGFNVGWLGWRASVENGFYLKQAWSSVGYPFTFRGGSVPATEDNIKIEKVDSSGVDGKLLTSQPYVEQGWSGGPLFGWDGDNPFVVGVVSAMVGASFYDNIFADFTYHAAGVRMAQLIQFGLIQWPA